MNRILIATDGSTETETAIAEGLELADETGAQVTFVFVRQAPVPIWGDPHYAQAMQAQFANGREVLAAACMRAEEAGIQANSELLEGDPATEIAALAESRNVDLIVVGSRGLGAVTGTLLGSVSRSLVKRATRPVLVVKAEIRVREPELVG